MRRINRLLALMLLSASVACALPVVLFTVDPPDGLLAGAAGASVGWGYTITTDSAFVTIETITFGDSTPIGIYSTPGVPSFAASFGSPINIPWIQDIQGLQYDISPSAILNASTSGLITLTYDAYSDAAQNDQIVFAQTLNAQNLGQDIQAEVDVNSAAPVTLPEPGTAVLLGVGALIITWRRRTPRNRPCA
jgi:hypothetical protein